MSVTELAMSSLIMFSSFCISLVPTKWMSRFSKVRARGIFLVKLGMNVDIKKLLSHVSFAGLACLMGQGWTPCVVITRPRYSMSCFLIKYFYGLNLSPAWQAFSKVFNRRMSWCSFVDPCTLTSSIHVGNLKGKCTKQYFLNGVLNAVRIKLALLVKLFGPVPLLASSVEEN